MKINYLLLFGLLTTMTLTSCGGTESTDDAAGETAEAQEKAAEPEAKACKVKSYSFQLGDNARTIHFNYDGENLKTLEMTQAGSDENQNATYEINSNGTMSASQMGESKLLYVYNDQGQLTEITGEGSYMTRTFEYDENGRMIKQEALFGGKPNSTLTYSYDGDVPNKVELLMKGKLYESYTIEYDDKNNPMKDKGAMANSTELRFGYAVANFDHNITTITTTNTKGEEETQNYTYEYNESGYPTSQKIKRGDREMEVTFEYDCN